MASGGSRTARAAGQFPNDSELRGKDRRLRRELPASDGNPKRVNMGQLKRLGVGLTPESLRPSATLDGPAGKFGLPHNSGHGPD